MRNSISSNKKLSNRNSHKNSQKKQGVIARVLVPLMFWVALWSAFAALVGQELLVPTPARVAEELLRLAATAEFWRTVCLSLCRIFGGLLAGVLLGAMSAVACCRFAVVDVLLSPMIRVVRATPVASFIVLLLLWVRQDWVSMVIAALMVLPIVWEAVCAGIQAADPELLEMARAYQMSRARQLRYIYLPALWAHFAAGLCTAIGLAWKSGVAAEVLCRPWEAIGTQLYFAKIYLETPALFAWTIVVVALSLLIESIVRRLMEVRRG